MKQILKAVSKIVLWKPEWTLTIPSLVMLLTLVGIPTLVILLTALRTSSPTGGVGDGWSLEAIYRLGNPIYVPIVVRTIIYTTITTVLCILIGLPVAYYLARCSGRLRTTLLLAVVIPFWTNILVHLCAWKMALHPDGIVKKALVFLNLVDPGTVLLYNPQTVILVMVHVFLPFAIIPLYATIEKFDFRLLESARDLGAGSLQTLWRVFLPGIASGIWSAAILVFVPVLGCYIVPQYMGNANILLLANKIEQRTFADRNLPEAAALSGCLLLAMLLVWLFFRGMSRIHEAREAQKETKS
ncbi:MAG: ABC transporter permease [Planctomycetia bacterium]|nr:ABC transporter permease [Planctomycetia bacterium]